MRDLLEVVHDPDVEFNPYYGPAPEHDCPCGSGLQAQHCHRAEELSIPVDRGVSGDLRFG
ncbi:SEC-C metal-binding domain-containing protein [Mycobacteroides abscessus]|uniref:SEC-C metal-binding domain-containing protein n=1 Tax=Mycobacteroides abscessus TaxID=36809 RepID=UPI0009407755|nr:SEC-C metal-binding domain-containing protein [Mycobacteroides abscessus]QSM93604.1 SEC-C domain-containing protein [Mycobacteroides abscessus subsp. abscessus]QSM98639.1 SEC-C domain-containing protein [Mycobacteroides abscessus subsp. abscessus]